MNDEKRCVVDVDKAPGLNQACTKGKRGQGGVGVRRGRGVMTTSQIIMSGLHNTNIRLTFCVWSFLFCFGFVCFLAGVGGGGRGCCCCLFFVSFICLKVFFSTDFFDYVITTGDKKL